MKNGGKQKWKKLSAGWDCFGEHYKGTCWYYGVIILPRFIDLTGQKFERLTVIERLPP